MRKADVARKTKETDITLSLAFDEVNPIVQINTGICFFDHMLICHITLSFLSRKINVKIGHELNLHAPLDVPYLQAA